MMENILWNAWQYLVDVFDCFLIRKRLISARLSVHARI